MQENTETRPLTIEDAIRIVEPPTAEETVEVDISSLSDDELQERLNSYPGMSWINTPEHSEMTRRQWEARCRQ